MTEKQIEQMLEAAGQAARKEDLSEAMIAETREQAAALLAARQGVAAGRSGRRALTAVAAVMILGIAVWSLREDAVPDAAVTGSAVPRLERTVARRRASIELRLRRLRQGVGRREGDGLLDRRVAGLRGRVSGVRGDINRDFQGVKNGELL